MKVIIILWSLPRKTYLHYIKAINRKDVVEYVKRLTGILKSKLKVNTFKAINIYTIPFILSELLSR